MDSWRAALALLICLFVAAGCAGVARMSDFPLNAELIDFEQLSKGDYDVKDGIWNERTEYQYFVDVEKTNEKDLIDSITAALLNNGYTISYSDLQHRAIIGERGLRANEWKSITGVYYNPTPDLYQVYFKNAITQDVTGGWRENRAKKVAKSFCIILKKCKKMPE